MLLWWHSASERGAEDVLVANQKQDCRDSFNLSDHGHPSGSAMAS